MKLYIHSNDELIKNEFGKCVTLTNIENSEVVFIDWPGNGFFKHFHKLFDPQKKTIIFDRFLSISPSESHTLRNKGVILSEPVVNFRRKYFNYIPYWIKIKKLHDIELNTYYKQYDIIFKGAIQDKRTSFNKYYIPYNTMYKNEVVIDDMSYTGRDFIKANIPFNECKTTFIIGSEDDYRIGYLDYNFIDALNNNCIPLVVNENKYFSSLSPYRINNIFDMNYIVSNYDISYVGWLLGIYETIQDYYPEMVVENVVKQIIEMT